MRSYDHGRIEKKWQKEWESQGIYHSQEDAGKPKAYVLDMFPYPSGDGLHVGHPKGYIATDIYSRHARMQGKNVLHPMGWDAFGLPAENFAIKNKVHPRAAVEKNVARFKEQLQKIGLDYDWSREINTTDPEYYQWTQWIFLKLLEKGLAYEAYEPINWCPSCQTGLANEDLDNGVCERCGSQVEKKPMRQWTLRITEYAERLLKDLDLLPEWQEHIKESQRNWIGKSEGAEIEFAIDGSDEKLKVFTTRPDTLFGVTYMVISPEHPILAKLRFTNRDAVAAYAKEAAAKSEIERTAEGKEKSGVKLEGVLAINPANSEKIPVYVADYVLAHYGTGAIMAVPAHDERDYQFARKFNVPVVDVVAERIGTPNPEAQSRKIAIAIVLNDEDKMLIQSQDKGEGPVYCLPGGGIDEGETADVAAVREVVEETGYVDLTDVRSIGRFDSHYWNPIRGIYRHGDESAFVMRLASEKRSAPEFTEQEKRATIDHRWVTLDEAEHLLRTHGVPGSGDLLSLLRVKNGHVGVFTGEGISVKSGEFDGLTSEETKQKITAKYGVAKVSYKLRDWVFSRQRYWGEPIPVVHCEKDGTVPVPYDQLPVKLPEVEHYEPTGTGESPLANIAEWVNTTCPKCGGPAKRETNTMPQWAGSSWYYLRYMDPKNDRALVDPAKEKYWAPVDMYVGGAEHATRHLIYARFWHKFLKDIGAVSTDEPFKRLISVGLIMAEDGRKMSKRYGNVINPDDIVETYGADTLRIYEMFMGPFTDAIAWKTSSLIGARRFLERVWKLQEAFATEANADVERVLNQTIKKVGEDIGNFKFNTAISQMMIFVNEAEAKGVTKEQYQSFVTILAPFAPHIADEIWHFLGNKPSVHIAPWPAYDESKLLADTVTLAVQVNGKARAEITLPRDASQADAEKAAKEAAAKWLEGKEPSRVIFVANRLVNLVLAK